MKYIIGLLLTILISFLSSSIALAQVVSWSHTWGQSNNDHGISIVVGGSSVYVAGTLNLETSNDDFLLMKYTREGILLWAKSWDFGYRERVYGVAIDSNNNIVIVGVMQTGIEDVLLVKVDSNGTLLWAKSWHNSWEFGRGVAIDAAGNVMVAGQTSGGGSIDVYLTKYDENGNMLWTNSWESGGNEQQVASITLDSIGNVYAVGYDGTFSPDYDVLLLKFHNNGSLQWARKWGVSGTNEIGLSTKTDNNGNVYATGWTTNSSIGGKDVLILKYDSTGHLLWSRTWGGANDDEGHDLAMNQDGNIYVVGYTSSFSTGGTDLVLLKYDPSGNLLNSETWGGSENESGHSILVTLTNDILLTGEAPNNAGILKRVTGIVGSPPNDTSSPLGTLSPLSVDTSSFSPTPNTLSGNIDIGGGGSDVLVIRLRLEPITSPYIFSIRDVPHDQGGKLTLRWIASSLDTNLSTIPFYSIWRAIPEGMQAIGKIIAQQDITENFFGKAYRTENINGITQTWEWIANQPAHKFSEYSYTASTLYDSMSTTDGKHYFLVSAHTNDPNVFYDSNVDSGYSVDNLAPLTPKNFIAGYSSGQVAMHWNANSELDLHSYELYRGSSLVNLTKFTTTSDTYFIDTNPSDNTYYAIRAKDIHDNLSALSSPVLTGVASQGEIPTSYSLSQNYPNPFNPSTTIKYALLQASHVSLSVFNTLSQRVALLVDGKQEAGYHEVTFDGSGLTSGVYFYRLQAHSINEQQATDYIETKKLILMK